MLQKNYEALYTIIWKKSLNIMFFSEQEIMSRSIPILQLTFVCKGENKSYISMFIWIVIKKIWNCSEKK